MKPWEIALLIILCCLVLAGIFGWVLKPVMDNGENQDRQLRLNEWVNCREVERNIMQPNHSPWFDDEWIALECHEVFQRHAYDEQHKKEGSWSK